MPGNVSLARLISSVTFLPTNQRVGIAMQEQNEFNLKGKIIQMKCPGCGAGLEISKDHQDFACAYCGSSLHVIRSGGTVALSLVDVVDQVRANTDRTASELALVRLADELQVIKSEISKHTETMSTVAVRPVPMFGYCFPLGMDRKPDYSKDLMNELGVLIGSASNMKCNTCREVKCCDGNELRTSEL